MQKSGMSLSEEKNVARIRARQARLKSYRPTAKINLLKQFPASRFRGRIIAGYWPLAAEIDSVPLLQALSHQGYEIGLPCTPPQGYPLIFRRWKAGDSLNKGRFGTSEPLPDQVEIVPTFIFVPLLAFTSDGQRLGYGGGYYDRTLAQLRAKTDVFACGVAYAGQETPDLPTGDHDQRLDGILTEEYFKVFE